MTWNYESFWVIPKGWTEWSRLYPHVECRWRLRVVFDNRDSKWKIVEANYSGVSSTQLDNKHLAQRFDTWQAAVNKAHDLVSTVARGGGLTWPEARDRIEAETDPVLV